jgi:hypothetical protein
MYWISGCLVQFPNDTAYVSTFFSLFLSLSFFLVRVYMRKFSLALYIRGFGDCTQHLIPAPKG